MPGNIYGMALGIHIGQDHVRIVHTWYNTPMILYCTQLVVCKYTRHCMCFTTNTYILIRATTRNINRHKHVDNMPGCHNTVPGIDLAEYQHMCTHQVLQKGRFSVRSLSPCSPFKWLSKEESLRYALRFEQSRRQRAQVAAFCLEHATIHGSPSQRTVCLYVQYSGLEARGFDTISPISVF